MIKRISTMPSLSSANDPITNRPLDLISGVSSVDLIELSISGVPYSQFDVGGDEEGVYSGAGWASVKTRISDFCSMVYERIMEKFLTNIDPGGGEYEATGEYMIIKDPDGITANDRYIPLYKKN